MTLPWYISLYIVLSWWFHETFMVHPQCFHAFVAPVVPNVPLVPKVPIVPMIPLVPMVPMNSHEFP